ncbi:hypothetical protein NECAME_10625 [Necator americanus]|uniref:Mos1 transposase HTH domain-containing protein n=1 Tax=Necator americanus TaxID=51031 RepID=W2TAG1_NECAM|nr:hypothetical protein NECAME_10625 [Necator americanus]ETN77997.1 hypothetical protein NECAME_10625 [Necator americanus]
MAEHSTHIRHVLLYEFESGHPAAEAHRNLSQVFGTDAPSKRSVRACFQRFNAGNKKLEAESRSGRPTAISFDKLKNLAEQHPYEGIHCCQSWLSTFPKVVLYASHQYCDWQENARKGKRALVETCGKRL